METPVNVSVVSNNGSSPPGEVELAAVEFQTRRTVQIAEILRRGRRLTAVPAPKDRA